MSKEVSATTYKGYPFPIEIINHCIWLYTCFSLSFLGVQLIIYERGIVVSHETVRQWYRVVTFEMMDKTHLLGLVQFR